MKRFTLITFTASLALFGCSKSSTAPSSTENPKIPAVEKAELETTLKASEKGSSAPTPTTAQIGQLAPDFALTSLSGTEVKLSDYRGKVVVLEWFNPGCPFVKAAHTKGSLVQTAQDLTAQGVVYLAINSGAAGKQGAGKQANLEGKRAFKLEHEILLDESGEVGRSYGATNTPQMFVIDQKGVLAYAGAVDNSPDGEGGSPEGGQLVKYMEEAVSDLLAGRPVSRAETKPYGCSVKYGS